MKPTLRGVATAVAVAGVLAIGGLAAADATAATPRDTPAAPTGSLFTPVNPVRILDTGTPGAGPGSVTLLPVVGAHVPAGATGVVLWVTAASASDPSYLTLYPNGTTRPVVSPVTFNPGNPATTDEVTVALPADGVLDIYNHVGTVREVVDLAGYYTQAAAPSGPVTANGSTAVSGRADSGSNGNWAVDAFTRTTSVELKAAAPVASCGSGATSCYLYEGTITDNGSFSTDANATSPAQGQSKAINGTVVGSFNGGSAVEFYASSNDPESSRLPATTSGNGESTTNWVEQFFPAGTTFGAGPNLTNWSWTYSAPNTCETWVDALAGQSGNIAGVNACG
jgi:hypothetical protein